MTQPEGYHFTSRIPATEENAFSMQLLTLHDAQAAGFEDPSAIANPGDSEAIRRQLERLEAHPEQYAGYIGEDGVLVGYAKTAEWLTGDEAPFVEGLVARQALRARGRLHGGSLDPQAHGIFGLVVDAHLGEEAKRDMTHELLLNSVDRARARGAAVVNIVLSRNDTLLVPMARGIGFNPRGRANEAAGAPGLRQRRYQRLVR